MYDYFLLASNAPFERHPERERKILARFSPKQRELILEKAGYIGDQAYIRKEASHYPINEDWKPVTEYYLGLKAWAKFLQDE